MAPLSPSQFLFYVNGARILRVAAVTAFLAAQRLLLRSSVWGFLVSSPAQPLSFGYRSSSCSTRDRELSTKRRKQNCWGCYAQFRYRREKRSDCHILRQANEDDDDDDGLEGAGDSSGNNDDVVFDMAELTRRVAQVKYREEESMERLAAGLNRRVRELEKTEIPLEGTLELPVVVFDALLPRQSLKGSTEDPTFARLLRQLGLGGRFVMTSLDYRSRKIRRHGVVAKIELVDAVRSAKVDHQEDLRTVPTSVDFQIVGQRRCRVMGPPQNMVARIGRWRRVYDPDGEQTMLGWGEEKFLDWDDRGQSTGTSSLTTDAVKRPSTLLPSTQWSLCLVDCTLDEDGDFNDIQDNCGDKLIVCEKAEALVPLVEKWLSLATNVGTYDNINVTASARIRHGHPGLLCDSAKVLRKVVQDLGDRPDPPSSNPNELCFWIAALINPLPTPLGVSPEVRGRVLEASTVSERVDIVRRALLRSIANLDGSNPL